MSFDNNYLVIINISLIILSMQLVFFLPERLMLLWNRYVPNKINILDGSNLFNHMYTIVNMINREVDLPSTFIYMW